MVQSKRSRFILDATYVTYLGTERINGTVRVLFKTRLIFSRINGPNKQQFKNTFLKKREYFNTPSCLRRKI